MKRFLLIIALSIFGIGLSAQVRVNYDVIKTTYDLQSNGLVSNRMYQLENGNVAVVATMATDTSESFADRGTGYNFFDGENWDEISESRIEDIRTGWPSIAPYGAEGEILVNHSEGLKYWFREKAGEGEWDGPHAIPNPENVDEVVGGTGNVLSWPKVATTGENHDIVHIFATVQGDSTVASYYLRTEDLQNWDVKFSPLEQDNLHIGFYNADEYSVSTNGNNIAVVYCGSIESHAMLYKSTDSGLTWESRIIWEHPYFGYDWETDENSLFDNLYVPSHASVAVDVNDVAHVALAVGRVSHLSLGSTYTMYYSIHDDGIAYWNDLKETPIRSAYDDNPNNALKLWWPIPGYEIYSFRDTINFCAYYPYHDQLSKNSSVYHGNYDGDIKDYKSTYLGISAYPSIAVDPQGNIAVAFTSSDKNRSFAFAESTKYFYHNSLYVSYKPYDSDKWYNHAENFNIIEELSDKEASFASAVSTPVNNNEFWFSCMFDDMSGYYTGTTPSQAELSEGSIQVLKFDANQFETVKISVVANNTEAGTFIGDGDFAKGAPVNLTAIPFENYLFDSWTLNGNVVSNEKNYSFVAEEDAKLIANFKSEVNVDNYETILTTYDLQSNDFLANRMYQLKDGSVAVVTTMSRSTNESFPDRGTGYNFFDRESWDEIPESAVENVRTGWPSIAPYGPEGEILVSHSNGLSYYTREKAGEGEWQGPHAIPNPEGVDAVVGGTGNVLSWARIVTTGENNDVLHIFANVAGTEKVASYYLRTTDLENWDIQFSPLEMDGLHINYFSADSYAAASNGDNIAVVYCGQIARDVMAYESNDAGLTWKSRVVWETPVDEDAWYVPEADGGNYSIIELYAPTQASVAISSDGITHVALAVGMYDIKPGGYYSLYYGLLTDGIAYWNDLKDTPIRSPQDDELKNALRLWWSGDEGTFTMDATNFCAWMPPHPEDGFNGFQASMQYTGSANGQAGDYLLKFGVCAYPSIAVDPMGNIAVAYSAPDVTRFYMEQYYYRSLYVSYKSAGAIQWEFSKLYDDNDSLHMIGECTYVSAVSNPVNINEFWFSCLTDDTPGFHTGISGASQTGITTGTIDVFKYEPSDNFGLYITATTNIPDAGYVDGVGQYYPDKNITITAYPYEGYKFVNWTENGEIVSTDESYTFIVDSHREFVANFIELPAPKNLVATPNTSAISLSWDKVENATSYNVYQNGSLLTNVDETKYVYEPESIDKTTEYCFTVTAVCDEFESDKSNEACAKISGDDIDELSSYFNIYPNPVEKELFIENRIGVEEISIYDVYGRQAMSQQVNKSTTQQVIDVAKLNAGVYFVKIVTDNGEIVKRFMKK